MPTDIQDKRSDATIINSFPATIYLKKKSHEHQRRGEVRRGTYFSHYFNCQFNFPLLRPSPRRFVLYVLFPSPTPSISNSVHIWCIKYSSVSQLLKCFMYIQRKPVIIIIILRPCKFKSRNLIHEDWDSNRSIEEDKKDVSGLSVSRNCFSSKIGFRKDDKKQPTNLNS